MQLDVITAFKIFNYGVDYGQLLMEQERENEELADAFNCSLVSRKTAMPAMPIERRQAHSEDWKQAKKKSIIAFKELMMKIFEENHNDTKESQIIKEKKSGMKIGEN